MCCMAMTGKKDLKIQRKGLIEIMKNWKGKVIDVKYKKYFFNHYKKKIKNERSYRKNSDLKKLLSKIFKKILLISEKIFL